jgi:hypothetical protein
MWLKKHLIMVSATAITFQYVSTHFGSQCDHLCYNHIIKIFFGLHYILKSIICAIIV